MLFSIILFIFGLAVGSFFNVCIYRIPRGKSLIHPPSHCPNCKKPIKPYDNIPVLSYILLAGKCRDCRKSISIRYPAVELLTAILFAAAYYKFGVSVSLMRAL
ncbi:MAG: prepilin peptidase, partial [candidate division WOR-3 bacterium]|nr:prepilin peptidase [candidate division WOR-3 bacterium]